MVVCFFFPFSGCAQLITVPLVVLAGSSGESATLTSDEKSHMAKRTREIAQANGRDDLTITVGCLAGCTRDIIDQTKTAYQSGADAALVLVPSVFHWAINQQAFVDFFLEVADHSPIPVMIYNFPGLTGGLDANSDMLQTLSAHKNISGVKLTCGGIGKITRIAALNSPNEFVAIAGQSDVLVPALSAGASGCISGVANLFPKVISGLPQGSKHRLLMCGVQVLVEIYHLYTSGQIPAAIELQTKLGVPEWGISSSDVSGMKWIIAHERGYPETSAHCRRPFPKYSDPEKKARSKKMVSTLIPVENQLQSKK